MYTILMFDLDDTLTDDYENIKCAFKKVAEYSKIDYTEQNLEKFWKMDRAIWKERAEGKIVTPYENDKKKKTEWLRAYRFLEFFDNKITYEEAVRINNIYMEGMKQNVVAREGCYETIKYLKKKGYKIIIATNGPIIPLKTKIEKIKIDEFVDFVFSAEEIGFMKPHKLFYEAIFEKAKITEKDRILFIGDELDKDIKGAIENNIDTCWCNYKKEKNDKYEVNYEIHNIIDLKKIL